MSAPRMTGTTPLNALVHAILGMQVDWIEGVTQAIRKLSAARIIIGTNNRLALDTKSFSWAVSFIILSILAFLPPGMVLGT